DTGFKKHFIISMVSRLAKQKGFHILMTPLGQGGLCLLDMLLNYRDPKTGSKFQIVVEGIPSDDYGKNIAEFLRTYTEDPRYEGQFVFKEVFDKPLAKRIGAGAQSFFMPSVDEPGGISNQEMALLLTLCVVTARGGLIDFFEKGGTPVEPLPGFDFSLDKEYDKMHYFAQRTWSAKRAFEAFEWLFNIYMYNPAFYRNMLRGLLKYNPDWNTGKRIMAYREIYRGAISKARNRLLQALGRNLARLLGVPAVAGASVDLQRKLQSMFTAVLADSGRYAPETKILKTRLAELTGDDIDLVVSDNPALIRGDAWSLATMGYDIETGRMTFYIHRVFLEGLRNKSPPEKEALLSALAWHEIYEYQALNDEGSEIYALFGTYLEEKPRTQENFHEWLIILSKEDIDKMTALEKRLAGQSRLFEYADSLEINEENLRKIAVETRGIVKDMDRFGMCLTHAIVLEHRLGELGYSGAKVVEINLEREGRTTLVHRFVVLHEFIIDTYPEGAFDEDSPARSADDGVVVAGIGSAVGRTYFSGSGIGIMENDNPENFRRMKGNVLFQYEAYMLRRAAKRAVGILLTPANPAPALFGLAGKISEAAEDKSWMERNAPELENMPFVKLVGELNGKNQKQVAEEIEKMKAMGFQDAFVITLTNGSMRSWESMSEMTVVPSGDERYESLSRTGSLVLQVFFDSLPVKGEGRKIPVIRLNYSGDVKADNDYVLGRGALALIKQIVDSPRVRNELQRRTGLGLSWAGNRENAVEQRKVRVLFSADDGLVAFCANPGSFSDALNSAIIDEAACVVPATLPGRPGDISFPVVPGPDYDKRGGNLWAVQYDGREDTEKLLAKCVRILADKSAVSMSRAKSNVIVSKTGLKYKDAAEYLKKLRSMFSVGTIYLELDLIDLEHPMIWQDVANWGRVVRFARSLDIRLLFRAKAARTDQLKVLENKIMDLVRTGFHGVEIDLTETEGTDYVDWLLNLRRSLASANPDTITMVSLPEGAPVGKIRERGICVVEKRVVSLSGARLDQNVNADVLEIVPGVDQVRDEDEYAGIIGRIREARTVYVKISDDFVCGKNGAGNLNLVSSRVARVLGSLGMRELLPFDEGYRAAKEYKPEDIPALVSGMMSESKIRTSDGIIVRAPRLFIPIEVFRHLKTLSDERRAELLLKSDYISELSSAIEGFDGVQAKMASFAERMKTAQNHDKGRVNEEFFGWWTGFAEQVCAKGYLSANLAAFKSLPFEKEADKEVFTKLLVAAGARGVPLETGAVKALARKAAAESRTKDRSSQGLLKKINAVRNGGAIKNDRNAKEYISMVYLLATALENEGRSGKEMGLELRPLLTPVIELVEAGMPLGPESMVFTIAVYDVFMDFGGRLRVVDGAANAVDMAIRGTRAIKRAG
ncbi:MAG: hypothetical protein JW803_01955, partial [Endomicrobiales bacterium]|nr:hypothetical protein [Endomicrobiales bacterium]